MQRPGDEEPPATSRDLQELQRLCAGDSESLVEILHQVCVVIEQRGMRTRAHPDQLFEPLTVSLVVPTDTSVSPELRQVLTDLRSISASVLRDVNVAVAIDDPDGLLLPVGPVPLQRGSG